MIAYQKSIRDAQQDGHPIPADFSSAEVREISIAEAKPLILQYEWLGTLGSSRRAFGLFFDGELAGVECFGATAGSNTAASVCGPEHAAKVMTLVRGACANWAHRHAASFLINRACRALSFEGKNIFVAYSDTDAGEIGTVYQASGWIYGGTTNPKGSRFRAPNGSVRDERCISTFTRRRGFCRQDFIEKLKERGVVFEPRTAKHRYIGLFGDRATRRMLRGALRWPVLPYPKRKKVAA